MCSIRWMLAYTFSWADQCQGGHDSSSVRQATSNQNGAVGQNAAMVSSSEYSSSMSLKYMIKLWYDEVKGLLCCSGKINHAATLITNLVQINDTTASNIRAYPQSTPKVIGHFTQLAWAKSTRVGCGLAYYVDGNMFTQVLLVLFQFFYLLLYICKTIYIFFFFFSA